VATGIWKPIERESRVAASRYQRRDTDQELRSPGCPLCSTVRSDMWSNTVGDQLTTVSRQWLHEFTGSPGQAYELSWFLNETGRTARVIRGNRMLDVDGLFGEISAALQFPSYFGNNWPALAECLGDLEWLKGSAYILLITNAAKLLTAAPPSELHTFFKVLSSNNEAWAKGDRPGATWPHQPTAFHVVLQELTDDISHLATRLQDLGFNLAKLVL
jgi:hypothetical protein